ncbi:hypothetical protein TWF696_001277 [Orbilia brochopaga]|uniref:BTB domain-containing protein n=1 Tax=Orbilia brochopaga TaxID=3140254 RepID=A0AAV9U857_9PEZI
MSDYGSETSSVQAAFQLARHYEPTDHLHYPDFSFIMAPPQQTAASKVALLLDSETISITVGDQGKILHVHRALFETSESPILQAIVSGKYKEGKGENGLDWTTEEVETVKRMLAFLYTGDYNVPPPKPVKVPAATMEKPPKESKKVQGNGDDWEGPSAIDTNGEEGETQGGLTRPLTPLQHHIKNVRLPTWRINTEAGHLEYMDRTNRTFEYGPLLIAHAKVYLLADYHQVESLMTMALERLIQTMLHMTEAAANFQADLVQLINFTYHQDSERPEDLRKLVAQFAALHFQEFGGEEWETVLEQGGLFMKDLCTRLGRRILNQEMKLGGARARIAQRQARQKNSGGSQGNRHASGTHPMTIPAALGQWYAGNVESADLMAIIGATSGTQ